MFSPIEIIAILIMGACGGVVIAIMGASGSLVMVPGLKLFLDFRTQTAMGTSLLLNVIAAVVAAYVFYRHRNIHIRPALWIAAGTVVGAQVGSLFADMIPEAGMSNLFGIFLIPLGIALWRRGIRGAVRLPTAQSSDSLASAETDALPSVQEWRSRLLALGLGLFVGLMCGLFAFGGGLMILLILVFVLRYPLHLAVGTSIFVVAINASSGALGYGLRGNMDVSAALIAAVPAMLTGGLGARVANRVSEVKLGKIMGAIFIILGFAMITAQFME
jgi:uncharacterized membrane protein YfcA